MPIVFFKFFIPKLLKMKYPITNFSLTVSIIIMVSNCQPKREGSHASIVKVNGSEVINCNISQVTDTIDLPLSELIKNCEVIQLETNDSSLFKSIYHASVSENYVAIHSRGRMPIKLFDRKGKFIRNIGKIGRGPGEFTSLYDIQLDEPANKVYLTPFANSKQIIVYDLSRERLDPIPLVYKQTKCKAYVDKDIVTVLSMPFKIPDTKPIPIAYQQTIDGKLIQEYEAPDHLLVNFKNEEGQNVGYNSELSSSGNAGAYDRFVLAFGSKTLDTLYHYDENKLVPKYVASFDGEKHGYWSYELKRHYYSIVFGKKYKGKKVLVDKKTLKSDYFNIVNDYYGGYRVNKFFMSNNGMFISSILPIDLIRELKDVLVNGDLKAKERVRIENLMNSLDENGNEVMFIGEMK